MTEPTPDEKAKALYLLAVADANLSLTRGKMIVVAGEIVLAILFLTVADAAAGGEWCRMGYNICLCIFNAINCWEMHIHNVSFEHTLEEMRTQIKAATGEVPA